MTTHSSIIAGKFYGQRSLAVYSPWGYKRVRHDLATQKQSCIKQQSKYNCNGSENSFPLLMWDYLLYHYKKMVKQSQPRKNVFNF